MNEPLAGLPFFLFDFDENGAIRDPAQHAATVEAISTQPFTDLFVFSHGWNNDRSTALNLYRRYFGELAKLLNDPAFPPKRPATIGLAGVVWPSILWPDEVPDANVPGGAASLTQPEPPTVAETLRQLYPQPDQRALVDNLLTLLNQKERDPAALTAFRDGIAQLTLANGAATDALPLDPTKLKQADPRTLFGQLADIEPIANTEGGAAGLGDWFGSLWQGAKAALRLTTYWTMKERGGVVGEQGLGPLLGRLHERQPTLRINLIGHSFGARLVSYALKGLTPHFAGGVSPIKQVFLMQGAFSHVAFARQLPFDLTRSGDLAAMDERVDGLVVATFSEHDLAVAHAYRIASLLAGQDAAAADDLTFRWQGMGYDGAQAVGAKTERLGLPGTTYLPGNSRFINLDGNAVIREGGLPSGAHSDIVHPHTAWVPLTLAGLR